MIKARVRDGCKWERRSLETCYSLFFVKNPLLWKWKFFYHLLCHFILACAFLENLVQYGVQYFSQLLDNIKSFCKKIIRIKFRSVWRMLKALTTSRNLQGGFFYRSALKMTNCQILRKFWHLELFWWNFLCNLTLSHFSGRTSKKKPPCIYVLYKLILPDLSWQVSRLQIFFDTKYQSWKAELIPFNHNDLDPLFPNEHISNT